MTYEYACAICGHLWESEQPISASPLKKCPKCHKNGAKRQVSGGAGFILKGSGWYADGYASPGGSKSSNEGATKSETKPDAKSDTKSDTKPDAKSDAKSDAKPEKKADAAPDTKSSSDTKPTTPPAAGA